jgi:hypothetical protein
MQVGDDILVVLECSGVDDSAMFDVVHLEGKKR